MLDLLRRWVQTRIRRLRCDHGGADTRLEYPGQKVVRIVCPKCGGVWTYRT